MRKNLIGIILFLTFILNMRHMSACGPAPDPAYGLPAFIDLTYIPTSLEISYGNFDRYIILLSHFLPTILNEKEGYNGTMFRGYRIANIEEEKKIFLEKAKDLLKINNIDISNFHDEISSTNNLGYSLDSPVCISNKYNPALELLKDVISSSKFNNHLNNLIQIRLKIFDLCSSHHTQKEDKVNSILEMIYQFKNSANSEGYANYLEALVYFYTDELPKAQEIFEKISNNSDFSSWLKETATYMRARIYLIKAQEKWDGYSDPVLVIDKELLAKAEERFKQYIEQYPQGLYQESVYNLQRKIYFLKGDLVQLNKLLREALNKSLASGDNIQKTYELLVEFRKHFKSEIKIDKHDESFDHPLLTSYLILNKKLLKDHALEKLEKEKANFQAYSELYNFLKATVFMQNGEYDSLLKEVPLPSVNNDLIIISIAVIRARSYKQLGRIDEAIAAWKKINAIFKDNIAQIELASLYADTHNFEVLLNDETISNVQVFKHFLQFAPTQKELEDLLEKNISESIRMYVEQELFRRYLITSEFKLMKGLYAKAKSAEKYSKIQDYIEKLVDKPNDATAHTEIAIFMYNYYIKPERTPNEKSAPYDLNGFEEIKPYCKICENYRDDISKIATPYDHLVKAALEFNKTGLKNEEEAKALHYLTKCFKGFEFKDRCQWEKNYDNLSKKWFKRLHIKYPRSNWTRQTPYYY